MNDKELAEYLVNLISPLCTRESVPVCRVNNNGTPVDINLRLVKELAETFLTALEVKQKAFQAGRKAGLGTAIEAVKAMEVDTDNNFVSTIQVGMKRAILVRLREALAGGGECD